MNEGTDGRKDGRTEGRADGGTDRRINAWTDGRMDGGTEGGTDGQTDGRNGGMERREHPRGAARLAKPSEMLDFLQLHALKCTFFRWHLSRAHVCISLHTRTYGAQANPKL